MAFLPKFNSLSVSSSIVVALSLSGCMSQQIANTKHMDDIAQKQAAATTQTPQEICETASIAIANADKEELYFYAPLHLEQASDNLQDGQDQIKNKETEKEGVKKCFKASDLIKNGLDIKIKVKSTLSDSLAELEMLKKVDSDKKYTDDIQDHKDDVMDIAKKIEAGKMNEAMQDQAELIKEMLELETDIVIDKNLTPVEVMIEKADDANADDLAEKTFEKAELELESARKFIRSNYRNNEQVEATSAVAMRAAKHALYVALEVETLKNLNEEAAEKKVLYIESLLEHINKKLNKDVVIGNSLDEQAKIIGQRVESSLSAKTTTLVIEPELIANELPNEQQPALVNSQTTNTVIDTEETIKQATEDTNTETVDTVTDTDSEEAVTAEKVETTEEAVATEKIKTAEQ